jgi:DinB superfamily
MSFGISESVLNQFLAVMSTLNQAIQNCSPKEWNEDHFDSPFSQVVFHVLIYTDLYLGRDKDDVKKQDFHRENGTLFRDYEEFEDRKPVQVYTKAEVEKYFRFCIDKGRNEILKETEQSLLGESGFHGRNFSRLEMYIYLIRHIQHHAAQLGLRNQAAGGKELKWVGSGSKDIDLDG